MLEWIQKIQGKTIRYFALGFCCLCLPISSIYAQANKEGLLLNSLDVILESSYQNNFSKATKIDSLEKYFCKLDVIENDSTRLRNKFKIVNSFVYINADSLEKKYTNSIKNEAIKVGSNYNTARAYNYLGDYYLKKFVLDSALYYINESEKLFIKEKDSIYLSYCYSSKADIYNYINDYNKALYYNFEALKQAQKTDKARPVFFAYQSIFFTLGKLKNEKKALEYYQKALEVLDNYKKEFRVDYYSFLAQAHNFMGSVYVKTENYDEAKILYQQGLEVPKIKEIFPSLHAALLDNLAYARYKSGDTANVKEDLERALFLKDSLDKPAIAIQTRLRLAEWHFDQQNLEASRQYAQQAFDDAKQHNITQEELQALQWLSKSDLQNQTAYFEEYIRINDSVIAQERIQRDKFARIEFETQELEKENALAQLDNEKLFRRNIITVALATITILILVLFYTNYRRRAQKKLLVTQQKLLATEEKEKQVQEEIMDLILHQKQMLTHAKQEEQKRISRDLHDDVSGSLSALNLQMHVFKRKKLKIDNQPEFDGFTDNIQKLQKRVREISHDLNQDKEFEQVNFGLAIQALVQPLSESGLETPIAYSPDFKWSDISTKIKLQIFRILQESIANTTKYAKAKTFSIAFKIENNQFEMCIKDDGIGFDRSKTHKGIGFKNMQERADEVHAELIIQSKIHQGTSVIMRVDLPKKERVLF